MGNLVFFVLIYNFLTHEISVAGFDMMARLMTWVSAVALVLVTIWILIQGYRIATGTLREPMMGLVVNMARIALVITAATSMSVFGSNLHQMFTTGLSTDINYIVTGDHTTAADTIDQNLAFTQLALSSIDAAAQVPSNDVSGAFNLNRVLGFATFGTASPPMAAAAMLLLYQIALALFIGLGPLFILCLIFEQTKELFRKWLLYGIGTLFSMAVLSLVSAMVLKLTMAVAGAFWADAFINGLSRANSAGLATQAMEQGGVGLLMTVLIVSTPPMAAMFFNGTMGNFLYYSAFGMGGARGAAAMQTGLPPGAFGGYGQAPPMHHQAQQNASEVPLLPSARGVPQAVGGSDEIKRFT